MEGSLRDAMVRRLSENPVVATSDPAMGAKAGASVGFGLGMLSGMLVSAGAITLGGLNKFWLFPIVFGAGLVAAAALAPVFRKRNIGHEYRFDERGVAYSNCGSLVWSVPWSAFVIEGYGLLGARTRLVLPDGRRVPFGEHFFSLEQRKAVVAVFEAFQIKKTKRPIQRTKMAALVVVSSVAGFILVDVGRKMVDTVFNSAESPTLAALAPGLALLVIGGIGVATLILSIQLGGARLIQSLYRRGGSKHGPLWVDYVRSHLHSIPAVELTPGARFKYIDPDRLKGHVSNGWGLFICAALIFGLSFIPPASGVESDIVGLRIISGIALLGMIGSLFLVRKESAYVKSLKCEFWIEGQNLHIWYEGRAVSVPARPIRARKGLPEKSQTNYMAWWEEYGDASSRIRIDRRFLWPVEEKGSPS